MRKYHLAGKPPYECLVILKFRHAAAGDTEEGFDT